MYGPGKSRYGRSYNPTSKVKEKLLDTVSKQFKKFIDELEDQTCTLHNYFICSQSMSKIS